MTTWYKQRIYCITDSKWEYKITENKTLITTCPIDSNHTINSNSISIIETLSDTTIKIKEEDIATGGRSRQISKKITASANSTQILNFSFTYQYDNTNDSHFDRTTMYNWLIFSPLKIFNITIYNRKKESFL